jgi:hypothetical protein
MSFDTLGAISSAMNALTFRKLTNFKNRSITTKMLRS